MVLTAYRAYICGVSRAVSLRLGRRLDSYRTFEQEWGWQTTH